MTKDEALRLALEALESTGENNGYHGVTQYFDETMVDQAITAIKQAMAQTAPVQEPVAWEAIEKVAQKRYKVVPSDASMFYRFAVVAGDGNQQLFIGRYTECQVMAKKFTGAFLDGAFLLEQMTTPPQQETNDEPVAWICKRDDGHFDVLTDSTCKQCFPVYTTPPQRTWIGLSDKLKVILVKNAPNWTAIQLIEETELLLKEKNT